MLSRVDSGYKPQCDVYFEETAMFKVHPLMVKRCGLLSKKWKTKSVTCLPQMTEGAYLAENLHCTPHCMESNCRRKFIATYSMKEKGLHVNILLPERQEPAAASGIIAIGPNNPTYKKAMRNELTHRLNLQEVEKDLLLQMQSKRCDRGNIAIGSGFASQNMEQDSNGVFAPAMALSTTVDSVKRMCALSDIMREVSQGLGIECPFTNNLERTQTFANSLCSNFNLPLKNKDGLCSNIIEHMTCALTTVDTNDPIMFGCHVDSQNCRCDGWNKVFVMYYHFLQNGKMYRLCLIAYSRAAINSYFLR